MAEWLTDLLPALGAAAIPAAVRLAFVIYEGTRGQAPPGWATQLDEDPYLRRAASPSSDGADSGRLAVPRLVLIAGGWPARATGTRAERRNRGLSRAIRSGGLGLFTAASGPDASGRLR